MVLAHRWSPRIGAHIDRLKAEAGTMMPVFLAFSLPHDDATVPEGCAPDIVVRPSDGAAVLPRRAAYAGRYGIWTGTSDRFSLPAMLGPLRGFERVWFVEYDVDFSGDWGDFFRSVAALPGDYVATHLRSRSDDPDWWHWRTLETPPETDPTTHLASFHPIARFSRHFLEVYANAVERGDWAGHTEALYPTIAAHHGLSVVDLGGSGAFVPEGWEGRHYRPPTGPTQLSPHFGYRPPFSFQYFHEAPELFPERGWLHHPVKDIDASGPADLLMDLGQAVEAEAVVEIPPELDPPPIAAVTERELEPAPIADVLPEEPVQAARPRLSILQKARRETSRLGRQIAGLFR